MRPRCSLSRTSIRTVTIRSDAGQGYMMILSLVMRPALMLFGLVGGMLLTQPIVGYINAAFMSVVSGIQADSMTGIVSFIAYVAIYVVIMTTVVHIVFSLIHWVPDNILRWIGQGATGGIADAERTGDGGQDVFVAGVRESKHGLLVAWVVGRNMARGQITLLPALLAEACQTTAHCWAGRPQEANYLRGRELGPSYPRSSRYLSKAF